uniref:Ciliary microtubule associated protein 1C n=1 Tax=Pseudonaja textilis TaxID=8673 RepID=A0A670YT55_PSETE
MVLESPGPCYYVDPSVSRLGIWRPVSFVMQQRGKSASKWPIVGASMGMIGGWNSLLFSSLLFSSLLFSSLLSSPLLSSPLLFSPLLSSPILSYSLPFHPIPFHFIPFHIMIFSGFLDIVTTPSPNEYHVEKLRPIDEPNAPAYSISARTPYWLNSPTPAPNKYALPPTLGPKVPNKRAAPCLSISSIAPGRNYTPRTGPGPAAYTIPEPDIYLRHQPSYTMSQRFIPSSKEHTPGPLDYGVEQVTLHKPRAPCFSLGVRHSEYAHGTPTVCLIQDNLT